MLFLVLGISPVVVGHLLLVGSAHNSYREVISAHFSRSADHTQMQLVSQLERVSNQIANIGRAVGILDEVGRANQEQTEEQDFGQRIEEVKVSGSPRIQSIRPSRDEFWRTRLSSSSASSITCSRPFERSR